MTEMRRKIKVTACSDIREMLELNNPIYETTSAYGHFGRKPSNKGEFYWEKTDKTNLFKM